MKMLYFRVKEKKKICGQCYLKMLTLPSTNQLYSMLKLRVGRKAKRIVIFSINIEFCMRVKKTENMKLNVVTQEYGSV